MTFLHLLLAAVRWLAYTSLAVAVEVASVLPADPGVSVAGVLTAALVLLAGLTYAPARRQS